MWDIGRARVVRPSIGEVQLLKFFLPKAVSQPELTAVLQRVIVECVERDLRGALVLDYDRPAMSHAELKAAVAGMDLTRCPTNFRLALFFTNSGPRRDISTISRLCAEATQHKRGIP